MAFWKSEPIDARAALRAEYRELRAEARKDGLASDRARASNRAGDLALELKDEQGALEAWGDALDLYLRDHHYHAARAVGRKLLRVRPKTVRVRSTLAWLAILLDLPADAKANLVLYSEGLAAEGQRDLAVKHLTAMANATADPDLRATIAEHLRRNDAADEAAAIQRRLEAEAAGEQDPPSEEEMRAAYEDALDRLLSPQ